MAVSLVSIRPIGLRPCATGGHHKPHWKCPSSSNCWTPLFGCSSEPDYIEPRNGLKLEVDTHSGSDQDPKGLTRSRFASGTFTDEKARRLRLMTTDTGAFHDAMYHSAIATLLASEFSDQSDP
ncbi:hypothetical protein RHSIM_Rhsim01G0080100 [Rhododendron simsii]|uniref:Uncharacterized protein n=1 Tax=Rhododendron simsii TaxID=118357 RepID=A0A834L409_RHOSS|nr:hypothetical protein RHSIM_RhsimUnG0156000 [Rhododendron simsii]KAF7153808.1 hypothetical protein RHSIM_Rhsim01G0080100 [Rhododendron simsii]